jgi:KaiC domain protein
MSEDDASDEEDDWFESALREADDADVADDADDADAGPFSDDESDAFDDAFADDADEESPFDEMDEGSPFDEMDEGSPFDEMDEGSPFEDAGDSPFGDDDGADDAGSPFDEEGDSSPFDDDGDDAGGLFDDDFASAMDSVGGGGGGGSEGFEDEDFESDIPRLDIGIQGLDDMIQGGVPERHLIVTIGGAGTGKTTFGLQFLYHGLAETDENAVFITLEQTYDDIMSTANERGWEFDRYEDEGRLAVIDLDPVEMANSLDNIRGELPRLIEDFGADRFVLDSVSLLEMMYDSQSRRRTEIFDFTQSLKEAGVTTLFTSEASEENPYASRYGIIEYLTDAVFLLKYIRGDTSETRLSVEIQKIRNANHSRQTKPYEITMDGISVYQQADIF